jgi:hypothetical protein
MPELRSLHGMKIRELNAADTRRRHHGTKSTKHTKTTKFDPLGVLGGLGVLSGIPPSARAGRFQSSS